MAVQDAQSNPGLDDETLRELGLTEQPFLENKKRQPVADSTTLKTRAALEQHVRFGESLHLLIGEEGAGKTVLLQQLLKHCKSSIKPFVVKGSDEFQAKAFLYAVLNDLTKEEHEAESVDDYIDALIPIFEQITADQLGALLIVDDAHLAPIEEIAVLVDTLQHFESESSKTARLLLTGTPALSQSIARFEEQFEELDLQYSTTKMQPLDDTRTREYLSTRLHQAGFADAFPFTDKAVAKIQSDSDGLPGRINESATNYLNGVYRNAGKAGAKAGWLSSIEWPVLAVGAAALGAIGIGLSMFFGTKSETEVIPVATDTTTQLEQPVVAPTSVPGSAGNTGISQDPLVKPIEPSFQSNNQDNNQSEAITENVAETVADTLVNPDGTNASTDLTIAENTNLVKETILESVDSSIDNDRLLPTEENAPELQAATPTPAAPETNLPTITLDKEPDSLGISLPAPSDSQLTAQDKSVGSTSTLADNSLLSDSQSDLRSNLSSDPVTSLDDPSSSAGGTSSLDSSGLLEGDTDAAAQPLGDNLLDTSPVTNPVTASTTTSTRAIENERWVLYQAPQKFTVQLATSRERSYIIDLAQTMEVQDPVAIYPFLTTNSNNPVFGLLSGLYDTRAEAIAAVESMSDSTKKFGVWIRPVSDLQADIKRRN